MKTIHIQNFKVGKGQKLLVISGPCVIESEDHALMCAEYLANMFKNSPFHFIFKASYDKANRSSVDSFRGPGLEKGLKILEKIKKELGLAVLSDLHLPHEAKACQEVLDVIQIPAFLCRQTDLLLAAAKTQKPLNIKKGQFLSPWEMQNVIDKVRSEKNENILLCDRGFSFGYNNLVSDMRAIPIMQSLGFPVCFDASHSTQLPGGQKTSSGGQREFISPLAKAAIAAGANALFIESHPDPQNAKSDAATVMPFDALKLLLKEIDKIYKALHDY